MASDGEIAQMPPQHPSHPLLSLAFSRVGAMLRGKWHLDDVLGVGGMACVYAATHRNGTRAAIKVLHPDLAERPGMVERFVCEGYLSNKVGHRGAVRVIDDDVDADGTVFLVMELLQGETLEVRRDRFGGRLAPEDALCIIDRVLDVLAAAHTRGIIHCDLKPDNLFVTLSGRVKVLDFGLAGIMRVSAASTQSANGNPAGTPSFMPPEQAMGYWDRVDARTDIWALGASLYTLLVGRYIRELPTYHAQLWAAATERAPSLGWSGLSFPTALIHLVDRAMEREPGLRFQTCAAMQSALRQCFFELQVPQVEAPAVPPVPQKRKPLPRNFEVEGRAASVSDPTNRAASVSERAL
jgi:eukaryotic-like serine/threonine-protein kinase